MKPLPLPPKAPCRNIPCLAEKSNSDDRDALLSKRASRRQRRSLKESGDFLGVQGVNPKTGTMDVMTPTISTSSTEAGGGSQPLMSSALKDGNATGACQSSRKISLEELAEAQHRLDECQRLKETVRAEQYQIMWRKETSQWSSVAEPKLSTIFQSRSPTSGKLSDPVDDMSRTSSGTIIHTASAHLQPDALSSQYPSEATTRMEKGDGSLYRNLEKTKQDESTFRPHLRSTGFTVRRKELRHCSINSKGDDSSQLKTSDLQGTPSMQPDPRHGMHWQEERDGLLELTPTSVRPHHRSNCCPASGPNQIGMTVHRNEAQMGTEAS